MNQEIKVLLIEDNPNDAKMTIRALKRNYLANQHLHLNDGSDALGFLFATREFIGRQTQIPKVILLDLNMPKVSGTEVLQKIKSDDKTNKIPVVLFTSPGENPDMQQCYQLRVNGYVINLVEFKEFQKAISHLGFFRMIVNQPPNTN